MMDFWGVGFSDSSGQPKQGHEYRTLNDIFGAAEVGLILRWKDGKLHDDGDLPAVEFEDAHIEHYRNGLLHNDSVDEAGKLMPAIIADYGTRCEYYIDGKQVTEG
jgi:hypothetical protein